MNDKNPILELLHLAQINKWPYPKIFDALIDLGITSYQVSWANDYSASFNSKDGEVKEPPKVDFIAPVINKQFSRDLAKTALIKQQQGKTNYSQWLIAMANAGVSHYKVNMANRSVTYFNPNETDSLQELVPPQV